MLEGNSMHRRGLVGLPNNSYKPITNTAKGCTRLAATSDKDYQLLAHGRWFSLGIPASSTTKTGRHNVAEKLLKVALNTINQIKSTLHRPIRPISMLFIVLRRIRQCSELPVMTTVCLLVLITNLAEILLTWFSTIQSINQLQWCIYLSRRMSIGQSNMLALCLYMYIVI